MTQAAKELTTCPEAPKADDAQIHALAWAMVEGVLDSQAGRLTLLHAAAMLKAVIAVDQPDPIESACALLRDHHSATLNLTRDAMAMSNQDPCADPASSDDNDFRHF